MCHAKQTHNIFCVLNTLHVLTTCGAAISTGGVCLRNGLREGGPIQCACPICHLRSTLWGRQTITLAGMINGRSIKISRVDVCVICVARVLVAEAACCSAPQAGFEQWLYWLSTGANVAFTSLMPSALIKGILLAFGASVAFASSIVNIVDLGAKPSDAALATCQFNTRVINKALAVLQPGDTLLVPNSTFHVAGGITGGNLTDITLQIDGTLKWDNNQTAWPRAPGGRVHECFYLETVDNLTITSSGTGTLDGSGGEDSAMALVSLAQRNWCFLRRGVVGILELSADRRESSPPSPH